MRERVKILVERYLNEVGEGTAKPYSYTSERGIQRGEQDNAAEDTASFTTEDGDRYEVKLNAFWGDNYWAEKSGNHFTIDFYLKDKNSGFNDAETIVNKGRLFRVMATIVQIAKEFMYLIDYKENYIDQLIVSPTKSEGIDDNRRANLYMAYMKKHLPIKRINYDGDEIIAVLNEVKQDKDIKGRKGTQPAKYYKGLGKSTKAKRDAHFKKQAKMSDKDPSAYKKAPGDSRAKTKPSKYTKKFDKMFGEDINLYEDDKVTKALKNKAKKANAPLGALRAIYNKGLAAWRSGHRPGAGMHQWGMARVNSVLTGGKARKVDAAQWKKIQKFRKNKKKK